MEAKSEITIKFSDSLPEALRQRQTKKLNLSLPTKTV